MNKIIVFFLPFLVGVFQVPFVIGGEVITGKGCYRFSDQESISVAREIALSMAKRDALEGYASGDGYLLCCPAHDDHNPSLSVRGAGDGRVLVHCHAGCSQEAVVSALKAMGLWGSGASTPSPSKAPRHP